MPLVLSGTDGVSGVDGTASNPAIEGTDSNTGIFYPAADTVAIGTGGTEALRVNSSQNVGIGTSSPSSYGSSRLAVVGGEFGVSNTSDARFYLYNGTTPYGLLYASSTRTQLEALQSTPLTFWTGGSERARFSSAGEFLVGTTTPGGYQMAVSGAAPSVTGIKLVNTSGSSSNLNMFAASSSYASFGVAANSGWLCVEGANNLTVGPTGAANVTFVTNGSERARITSDGYFKASNLGTYYGSGQPYHELRNSASSLGVAVTETNNSYANEVIRTLVARFQTSAYQFFMAYSNDGSDLEFNLRGDGNGYADGTWNNNGADYAEFFESATGAALTLGATVVLDGNKVREATDQDPASAIMGVVRPKEPSKASMVVGNTAWNKWANKYLTDDFDRYIMEDHDVLEWTDEEGNLKTYESHNIPAGVTVPDDAVVKTHDDKGNKFQHYKLNPAWNPDAEYVNRENRPEWIIVGLVGQVKILKGQPVNDRWIKMRDVSATVEEWMIR